MNKLSFFEWFLRVKYALVAAGVFKRGNYGVQHIKLDEKSWKHFYDDGFSPIEAVIEDIKNQ
jgi:hypothetical protein